MTYINMDSVERDVVGVLSNIIEKSPHMYNTTSQSSEFRKLLSILAYSQGSTDGRKNYKTLLKHINDIGINNSERIRNGRPLGFSLEGLGMGVSVIIHIMLFIIIMIALFFTINVGMLRNEQTNISTRLLGGKVAEMIDPVTESISDTSIQSLVVKGEIDRYYDQLDKNSDDSLKRNNKECVHTCIAIVASVFVLFVVTYLVSEYVYYNKIEWFRMLVYILTVIVLFGIFEAVLFITVILNYNPMARVEEQQLFLRMLHDKLKKPVTSLYSNQEEYDKDQKLYRSEIMVDIIKPLLGEIDI
jgi:hypothetical protein